MPISSWSNWPPQSPRRPRSPSSDLTSSASSAFSSPTPSFSLESGVSNKEAIAWEDGVGPALKFLVPKVRFAWWRRPRKQQEEGLEVYLSALRRFSLRELQVATNNFVHESILKHCGYWIVYRGILADGSLVMVTRLRELTLLTESSYRSEIKMISLALHENLLRLHGFCMTSTERLLVYPYMANGSLASRLRGRPPLDWPTRRRVALGTARGLSHMHNNSSTKILHRDVKASNIFFDEEFGALLGGFELIELMDCNDTHITTSVRGTIGHIAPEYLSTRECSEKTDVFSYGITLLELVTGKSTTDLARLVNCDVMSLNWVNGLLEDSRFEALVDQELNGNYIEADVDSVIRLALLCSRDSPVDRPKMSEVVRMLEAEDLAEITERWEEFKKLFDERHRESELTYHDLWLWRSDSTDDLASIELSSPR